MRLATVFRTTTGVIYRSFVIVQLRDRPQNFTFALEALLLGQIFICRTISQPLSSDIPAAWRGLVTKISYFWTADKLLLRLVKSEDLEYLISVKSDRWISAMIPSFKYVFLGNFAKPYYPPLLFCPKVKKNWITKWIKTTTPWPSTRYPRLSTKKRANSMHHKTKTVSK